MDNGQEIYGNSIVKFYWILVENVIFKINTRFNLFTYRQNFYSNHLSITVFCVRDKDT